MSYIVGIDEAGRGPLAGPVAVGVVAIPKKIGKSFFKGIKDSKKLSLEDRELWFEMVLQARRERVLDFSVALVSERVIDRKGIAYAIKLGIRRGLKSLKVSSGSQIFLDGGIKAPEEFVHQTTVVRGDEKIPVVSLASIVAKVTRDRKMARLSKKYPKYNFHIHKGYATKMHREAIKKFGVSEIHRQSFLTRLLK